MATAAPRDARRACSSSKTTRTSRTFLATLMEGRIRGRRHAVGGGGRGSSPGTPAGSAPAGRHAPRARRPRHLPHPAGRRADTDRADHHDHRARRRAGTYRGTRAGADDYITKPFSPREVVARVRAVLRRAAALPPQDSSLSFGDVHVDLERHVVTTGGRRSGSPRKSSCCCATSWNTAARCRATSCSRTCGAIDIPAVRARSTCTCAASARSCPAWPTQSSRCRTGHKLGDSSG